VRVYLRESLRLLKANKPQYATLGVCGDGWRWSGAASLSQLAQSGTSNPSGCKFPEEVNQILLTEVIEILSVTEIAKASIAGVAVWKI
jgi:hypothetical protein